MAAPRRALNSALLRIVAQPAIRSTCKASTFLHAAPRSQIERLAAATTTQRATSLRWYSSNDHQHEELITGSKRWEAEEIRKQIEINKQLKASGEEKTESGEGQVIFVGMCNTSYPSAVFSTPWAIPNRTQTSASRRSSIQQAASPALSTSLL